MTAEQRIYDAVVIGGGPGGATAALAMARAGLSVRLCERAQFPRFHVGESFLPRNLGLLRELGLEEELRGLPHVEKRGAEFAFGHGRDGHLFPFVGGLVGDLDEAFSIERGPFDAMLLRAARQAGAEVDEGAGVREIVRLEEGDVRVVTDDGEAIAARLLIDASGQATLVGRYLGTRKVMADLKKVAYWGHFEGVERRPGVEGGFTRIVMADEGWFWIIPVDEGRDSIGLVMDAQEARRAGVPAQQILGWGVARCPVLRQVTAAARHPTTNQVCADFSYRCRPCSGPGYFLVGDAATFVDPIFSTGACMAMMSAVEAARSATRLLRGHVAPGRVRRRYNRYVEQSSTPFFRMARGYYDHSFRELFVNGVGPLEVHKAALSVLAGSVFPRPVWALRWRLWLLFLMVRANRHWAVTPRREHFSLFGPEAEATAAGRPWEPAGGMAMATAAAEPAPLP
jgi:flavin-dependent dehydrogenase